MMVVKSYIVNLSKISAGWMQLFHRCESCEAGGENCQVWRGKM